MASKNKKTATIVIVCAAVAVIFFIAILIVALVYGTQDDPYGTPVKDDGMVFTHMDVDIVWNDDRSCKITQYIEVEFRVYSHGIYVDIPVNSGEKVRDLSISTSPDRPYSVEHENGFNIVRAVVGDEYDGFRAGEKFAVTVKYDYITPKHKSGADVLAFMAIGKGWSSDIESASVSMTYPAAPENAGDGYGVWVSGNKVDGDSSIVTWSNDGKTVHVDNISLNAFNGVEIAYKMPDGTMHNYKNTEYLVTLIIGAVLLVVVVLLKLLVAKNKPLTPIVDYYPPRVSDSDDTYFDHMSEAGDKKLRIRRLLPVQLGKIIDDDCSSADVTSLIFYWANKGFVKIEDREDDTYIIKVCDVDAITPYERELFEALFRGVHPTEDGIWEVSVGHLKGVFYDCVSACKKSVYKEYRGKFYKPGFSLLSFMMTVLCGLYGVCVAVFTSFRIAPMFFNLAGVLALIPVFGAALAGMIIAKCYFKLGDKKRKLILIGYALLAVIISFAVSLVIGSDVMGWPEKIIFVVCLAATSAISPFLIVRKPEYNEKLNSVIGFRDFLRDAEKDRLEAMLEEDPQYYYDILPYANVLGVSDIWEDKFKDITVQPPDYYSSYDGRVFDVYVMSSLVRNVRSSLTYVPSRSSGSLSGGSFGGGGGFSGGSFGGGGGGRW